MKHLIYITVVFFILCSSCWNWKCEVGFRIANHSSERIVAYTGLGPEIIYPDTVFPLGDHWRITISPMDTAWIGIFVGEDFSFREIFRRRNKDTISVFLVNLDSINKYGWAKISKDNIIAKRYDMSPEDFETIKYTISYPPTPEMSHIKMWPPYGK